MKHEAFLFDTSKTFRCCKDTEGWADVQIFNYYGFVNFLPIAIPPQYKHQKKHYSLKNQRFIQ